MPRLRFVSTVQGAATFELQEPIITVGRDPDNVVSIEDPNISKHHVLLIKDGETYKIFDLHSVNGTTVNGHRITAVTLKEGDAVRIGYLDLTYEIAQVAPSPNAPVGTPPVQAAQPAIPPSPILPSAALPAPILSKPENQSPAPVSPGLDEPPVLPAANDEPAGVPSAIEPATPLKPTLGGIRKPLLRPEPVAAVQPPPAIPAPQPAQPTPPASQAETAILSTMPPVPAPPQKPTLGTLRPKPFIRPEPTPVAAPPAAAQTDAEPTPTPPDSPAPSADAPATPPPSGPRKFGAPPAASGTKFRLKRE